MADSRQLSCNLRRPKCILWRAVRIGLTAPFGAFERDPKLWVAIVTGAGDKAFSAGADLRTPITKDDPRSHKGMPVPESSFAGLVWRFNRRKPVIAAVNGFAMDGGFEAALACDIIVAADTASFGLTEPRVGLAALGGGIQRIVQELGAKRASAMLLTASKIDAAQAHEWGLVAEVSPASDLLACARRLAERICECSPASVIATKAVMQSYYDQGLEESNRSMFPFAKVRAMFTGPGESRRWQGFRREAAARLVGSAVKADTLLMARV